MSSYVATIAQKQVLFKEDFSGDMSGWVSNDSFSERWEAKTTNNAGGVSPELSFSGANQNVNIESRFISPEIDLSSYEGEKIELTLRQFLWKADSEDGVIGIDILNDGQWESVWTTKKLEKTINKISFPCPLNNADKFQFSFIYKGNLAKLKEWSIDNIEITYSPDVDVEIKNVLLDSYVVDLNENTKITMQLKNIGTEKITSMEVNYQVGNNFLVSEIITELDFDVDAEYNVEFSRPIDLLPHGKYDVKVWVSKLNNIDISDYPISFSEIEVNGAFFLRKLPLVEYFSSVYCAPCQGFGRDMKQYLNRIKEKYVFTQYQTKRPVPGDKYYNEDGGIKASYYNMPGAPSAYINGKNPPNVPIAVRDSVNSEYEKSAEIDLKGTFQIIDSTIKMNVSIVPYLSGEYTLFVSVNQGDMLWYGAYGQTNVMMKMLPDGNGTPLEFTYGQPINIDIEEDLSETLILDYNDIIVTMWVQNIETKHMLNSAYATQTNSPLSLSPPMKLRAINKGLKVLLEWESPSLGGLIDGYDIYRNGDTIAENIKTTSYEDINVEEGIYSYYVRAIYAESNLTSPHSRADVFVTPLVNAPENIKIETDDYKVIDITWDHSSSENVKGYNIYRSGTKINSSLVTETHFTDNIPYVGTYYYQIRTETNDGLLSDYSERVYSPLHKEVVPDEVSLLQLNSDKLVVSVSWSAPGEMLVDGYNIYRDDEKINENPVEKLSYMDTLFGLKSYCYNIKAIVRGEESGDSGKKCIDLSIDSLILSLPVAFQVTHNKSEINVSWNKMTSISIDGYNVYRDNIKLNEVLVIDTFFIDNISEFTEYCYSFSIVTGHEEKKSEEFCLITEDDTGIKYLEDMELISLYPNPVENVIFIETKLGVKSINVYDINGHMVYCENHHNGRIYTDKWTSGTYVVKIETDSGIFIRKVIKR